jgi:hypothetical protein
VELLLEMGPVTPYVGSAQEAGDLQLLIELARTSAKTEPGVVKVRPYEAWLIIASIQATIRNAGMSEDTNRQLEHIGRQFQSLFAGRLEELLERGWHPEFDVADPAPASQPARDGLDRPARGTDST